MLSGSPVIGQHPFISQAKPVSILRDLITEAMEMKAKRQQEQQRELEEEDDNSVRILRGQSHLETVGLSVWCRPGRGDRGGLSHHGQVGLRRCRDHEGHQHHE